MKQIKLLLADDHPFIRAGIKQILEDEKDIQVAAEVGNAQEAIEKIRKNDYSIVILDISMPGISGIDAIKQIKVLKPNLPILVLSMFPEDQFAIRALRAGASGYITKDSAPENLVTALRKVSEGGRYVTSTLAERLAEVIESGVEKPSHEKLSDREYEIFRMIASGKTVSEIAKLLFLSVETVSSYRTRILDKMNMKKNSEIIIYAIKKKLIE